MFNLFSFIMQPNIFIAFSSRLYTSAYRKQIPRLFYDSYGTPKSIEKKSIVLRAIDLH